MSYKLQVMSDELQVMSYELQVTTPVLLCSSLAVFSAAKIQFL